MLLKGVFSGGGFFVIALILREQFPAIRYVLWAMLLGFVAYGLSIFLYIRAQRNLGSAKTSAYYAVAPFIGAFLSFILIGEPLTASCFIALLIMAAGTVFVVMDTLVRHHAHLYTHTFSHTHDGATHTHTVSHAHEHDHYAAGVHHGHYHAKKDLEALLQIL